MACGFAAEALAGWTYNPGTGLLTDGNWQLMASGSGNLTIKGMVAGSTAYETLDLRDPIGTETPWADLMPVQTNKYWTNYPGGKRPTAMWSLTNQWTPNRNLWLLPWNPKPTGMKLIFR